MSRDGCRLYVADTNNHCVKVVYLEEKIIEKVSTSYLSVDGGSH